MSSESEHESVALVRLEGKIDALSAKLDGRLDAVMATIEAGDRESLQLFELQKSEVGHVAEAVRSNTLRIGEEALKSQTRDKDLENEIGKLRSEFDARIGKVQDDVADFDTVRKVVFGLVALILIGVVTGLLGLVIFVP